MADALAGGQRRGAGGPSIAAHAAVAQSGPFRGLHLLGATRPDQVPASFGIHGELANLLHTT